tara:strand:+ start:3679 stop:4233 length:555 start_codon:yes stop_codon:yes gene_type:complete
MFEVKKILLLSGVILTLLIGGFVIDWDQLSNMGDKKPGEVSVSNPPGAMFSQAPDFQLPATDGEALSLSKYKGKVIILDFWATWCAPCRMEIPGFIELQDQYSDDLIVVGVSMDVGNPQQVINFMEEMGINYPIVHGDFNVGNLYGGVQGIPTTFVIDRNFVIQKKYVGFITKEVFEKDVLEFI